MLMIMTLNLIQKPLLSAIYFSTDKELQMLLTERLANVKIEIIDKLI